MNRRVLVAGSLAIALAVVTARAVGRWGDPPSADDAAVGGAARVAGIYPTATRLPANLLRLYIVFSEPMSADESRQHLRLIDAAGHAVKGAFLELDEELWDPSGTRLTVLFDPGRIKRGLRANLEEGAPLVEGARYRLVVDGAWRDARGRPLQSGAVKELDVGPVDRAVPDVDSWSIEPPQANSRTALVLRFDEPLDRALLSSAIAVEDEAGARVSGRIEVGAEEREWSFTPDRPWAAGRFVVRVSTELEDVAGNNLHRLFDVDLSRDHPARGAGSRARTFVVAARRHET